MVHIICIHVYVLYVMCEIRTVCEVCIWVWVDVHLSVSGINVLMCPYVHLSTFCVSDGGGSLAPKF